MINQKRKQMKIKYKYNVHHQLDNYPTEEDALFDICTLLEQRGKLNDEWSDLGIKPAFHKKLEQEELDSLLDSLTKQGYIKQRIGAGKRKYYVILKHNFGEFFPLLNLS